MAIGVVTTVRFQFDGLARFKRDIDRDLRLKGNGPIRRALKQWSVRYLDFTKRRYIRYSRGAGDWPPLKPSTIRRRKKGKKGARGIVSHAILIDTGNLLRSLQLNAPGSMFKHIDRGVRVGFAGTTRHPGGKATYADIAHFHNTGAGRLPQRTILAVPDQATVRGMVSDMERAVAQLLKKHDMRRRGR